ncbi:peptidylprolyl isomerase [Chamaesiphon polymorphus]|uniref:peptidylprolyl isomerase n=1 Tax=Chamaesiphon polymorphus CCALA 037 TaxID=2107692 RepID=A0A2T1FID9_9CYAN|nr:peptidylprolyl isomerase [Chamaesiphon polymorphus]PSB44753.1 peptidylprolyl isomerase [Chamaesiphon polymorphus CCALA 037]
MSIDTNITTKDILEQLKISRKIPEIIEQILTRRIVIAEAEKLGIKVEIPELQEAADLFRAKNRLISARITEKWLEINQLSLDEFEAIIHLELLSNKLRQIVLIDKVEQYFYQHQLDFDRVVISEVILANKELATELYYAIREGEISFQDVAIKYITDPELKRKGGYLGQIKRKDLNAGLRSIFSVTTYPQVIKPIATAQGFHLIWLEEKIDAKLESDIYEEIQSQLFTEFLREKIASSMTSTDS